MNSFISHLHATIRGARASRRGATRHPKDVPQGTHKSYPRMPQVALPKPESISMQLDTAIIKRRSLRESVSIQGFTDAQLGTLLGVALGKERNDLRHYPSGGGLYPIETYILGNVRRDKHPSVFHYNPSLHVLEELWDLPENFSTQDITTTRSVPTGSALIIFTSVWERSSAKYGDLTYLHSALEAGHMAQNILLVATALGIAVRPLAGFNDAVVNPLLDLDEMTEQAVYSILLSSNDTPR